MVPARLFLLVAAALLSATYFVTPTPAPPQLVVAQTVRNTLTSLYSQTKVEFAFCAYGTTTGRTVKVTRISLPEIYAASEEHVEYGACPAKELLGYGHSHPEPDTCISSKVDDQTFLSERTQYAFLLCPGQIVLFTRHDAHGVWGEGSSSLPLLSAKKKR